MANGMWRVLAAALGLCAVGRPAAAAEVRVWAVDPLIKVVGSDRPAAEAAKRLRISAARGEHEAGQLASLCSRSRCHYLPYCHSH